MSSLLSDVLNLSDTRVFVAGDAILDCYIEGKVMRISPEAPVPVVLETQRREVLGGAANVAANIAFFGARAYLCGRVGKDREAEIVHGILEQYKIPTKYLIHSSAVPTTSKMRVVSGSMATSSAQQVVRIDREKVTPLEETEVQQVIAHFEDFLKYGGKCALVISDYGKGFLTQALIKSLIEISRKHGVPVITDPKSEDASRYAGSTIIKPNLYEGRSVFRANHILNLKTFDSFEKEVEAIADCYLQASSCENLVMSLSEHGVMARGKAVSGTIRFETRALQVADVSGAGDTLVAFLAMGSAAGLPLEKSTELGNLAAGIVCGKLGTSTVSLSEFIENLNWHHHLQNNSGSKIISLSKFVPVAADLRQNKKEVVFTNGCFDILHAGHVDYLQKAKSKGHVLVVGLNADASVRRLKGPTRPVQTFSDRAMILASLSCVDFVVEFEEDTPLETIRAIKPNVLVKGADYNIETTVGASDVLGWGGRVEHIELLAGRSTTSILERAIKNAQK